MLRVVGGAGLLCLLMFAGSAWGAQSDAAVPPSPLAAPQLMKMTVALSIVVVAIFGVAYLVQRFGRLPASGQGHLKVMSSLAVGPKERIVLLQVGKEQVLVGVTPSEISRLHVLTETIDPEATARSPQGQSFAQRLQATLKGQRYEG